VSISNFTQADCRPVITNDAASADKLLHDFNAASDEDIHSKHLVALTLRASNVRHFKYLSMAPIDAALDTLHQLSLSIRNMSNRNLLASLPKLIGHDEGYTLLFDTLHVAKIRPVVYDTSELFQGFVKKLLHARWLASLEGEYLVQKFPPQREAFVERCVRLLCIRRRQLEYYRDLQRRLTRSGPDENDKWLYAPELFPDGSLGSTSADLQRSTSSRNIPIVDMGLLPLAEPTSRETSPQTRLASAPWPDRFSSPPLEDRESGLSGVFETPPSPVVDSGNPDSICPYCQLVLPVEKFSGHEWRQHVLDDLQPYFCLHERCEQPDKSYSREKSWKAHMVMCGGLSLYSTRSETAQSTQIADAAYRLPLASKSPENGGSAKPGQSMHNAVSPNDPSDGLPDLCFVCLQKQPTIDALLAHIRTHLESMFALALPPTEDADTLDVASYRVRSSLPEESTTDPSIFADKHSSGSPTTLAFAMHLRTSEKNATWEKTKQVIQAWASKLEDDNLQLPSPTPHSPVGSTQLVSGARIPADPGGLATTRDQSSNFDITMAAQDVSSNREQDLPQWGRRYNSDSMAESPWARKVILSLGKQIRQLCIYTGTTFL
jgi:hypothetical protein